MKKRFVNGFLFSDDGTQVLLLRKTHPEWQAGKLNGIGGKVEDGERFMDAMCREFLEETGARFEDWELTIRHEGPDWIVLYYRGYCTTTIEAILDQDSYPTDEIPELWPVHLGTEQCVRNAKWAVQLSNDRVGVVFPVSVVDSSPF